MKVPGPICTTELGDDWMDAGTSVRTRTFAPADRFWVPPQIAKKPKPVALSVYERQVLAALDAAGITDLNERAMFLAQMSHESSDFKKLRENMHYTGKRLFEVFKKKFKNVEECEKLAKAGPDAIAERLYGGRMGNVNPGDGARYIGRGYIHLTGRDNYTAAGTALNLDLVNHPELAEQRENAARIAVWYWQTRKIGPYGRKGDAKMVTFKINGGQIGLAERTKRYQKYRHLLASDKPAVLPWQGPVPDQQPPLWWNF